MGIDITAYRKINLCSCPFNLDEDGEPTCDDGYEWVSDKARLYLNDSFPGRADEITDGGYYSHEDADHCLSMGYIGYGAFRLQLAKLAGYPVATEGSRTGEDVGAWLADGGPFWEIINFSDCEGVIGAKVAAKLANDFADFQVAADACIAQWGPRKFSEIYNRLRAGVEMAADGGALKFS